MLIASDEAEECVGRIVGSSSVELSKLVSVPASLAVSDAAVEWLLEYEPAERRNAVLGPTCGVWWPAAASCGAGWLWLSVPPLMNFAGPAGDWKDVSTGEGTAEAEAELRSDCENWINCSA